MLYSKKIEKALLIAHDLHNGQTDRAGAAYIHHPIAVAEEMHDEKSTIVALLHDTLEDCDISPDELQERGGFSDEIMDSLKAITRCEGEEYPDYIIRLAEDQTAREVKLADLKHNLDLKRLPKVTEKDRARIQKYVEAVEYIEYLKDHESHFR